MIAQARLLSLPRRIWLPSGFWNRNSKVSERERFYIESHYYLEVTGELEKAAHVYELWQQTYPRDDSPYGNLGFISDVLGNREKALEENLETLRLEPNSEINYENVGSDYTNLNRLDEAEAVYKQAEERKFEGEFLLQNRYELAFVKGDTTQMTQLAAAAMGKPGTEDLLLAAQADTEAWYGKLKHAHELTRRARFQPSTTTPRRQHQNIKRQQRCTTWNRETGSRPSLTPMQQCSSRRTATFVLWQR